MISPKLKPVNAMATHVVNGVYTYDANYDEYIGLGTSMAWPNNSVYPTEELGTMRYVANRNAISPNGDSIRRWRSMRSQSD